MNSGFSVTDGNKSVKKKKIKSVRCHVFLSLRVRQDQVVRAPGIKIKCFYLKFWVKKSVIWQQKFWIWSSLQILSYGHQDEPPTITMCKH